MKVLQLYYKMPFPVTDGGAYSIFSASKSLQSKGIVTDILAMKLINDKGNLEDIPPDFLCNRHFELVTINNKPKIIKAIECLLNQKSFFEVRFKSENFSNCLINLLKAKTYDIIQLEHLYLCQYVDVIRKYSKAKVILRAQNVEYKVWLGYIQNLLNPFTRSYLRIEALKLKKLEISNLQKMDGVIALTEHDAGYFRSVTTNQKIVSIPIGVDIPHTVIYGDVVSSPDLSEIGETLPVIYHLGSMDWRPNIQGLKWFVKKVMPLIINELPDIKIYIAGKNMPSWFFKRGSNNLIVNGTVKDSLIFQNNKPIMIVPLLSGSGIRVKIIEAMAQGKTIITTGTGALGINPMNRNKEAQLIIADTPQDFAVQVCRCVNSKSLCLQVGNNAMESALANYNIEKIGERMVSFYESLLAL